MMDRNLRKDLQELVVDMMSRNSRSHYRSYPCGEDLARRTPDPTEIKMLYEKLNKRFKDWAGFTFEQYR